MESYSFKSVAFGGFDKQDVVRYLEQSSEKAAAAQRELEAENEMLHRQAADQMEELDRLRVQVEELTEQRDRLREKLETEAAVRADLEPLRALEQEAARVYGYEVVNVVPQPKAGGSFATSAYKAFEHPVAVEHIKAHAGIDIGDTLIGMHLREVAVPVRIRTAQIGDAHVTCARTRPRFIGGSRAMYDEGML